MWNSFPILFLLFKELNNNFINDLEDNKLKIVNNNKIIEVDLNNKFKYIDKSYNITIIDIKGDNYGINNYFNLNKIYLNMKKRLKKMQYIFYIIQKIKKLIYHSEN